MQTTHVSSKGQVIIPKSIRDAYQLNTGQELEVEIVTQGILLKIKNKRPKSTLNDLIGCAGYQGKAKTLDEMEASIQQGIIAEWGRNDRN
jgi:AbrB family looped-hinge helix DNA binding protein